MKKILPLFLLLLMAAGSLFAQTEDTVKTEQKKFTRKNMIPKFTCTVLGRYEYNTNIDAHHFEMRHTRVGVSGDIHPMFSYMALVDLTYGGAFSPVAIFAKFKPVKGLSFLIGFDKMPFSSENLLSPYQYYFADKSFLTQKLTAWADVGGVVAYKWDKVVPFEVKLGVFNGQGFSKQMQFQNNLMYVARGTFDFPANVKLSLNYASTQPEAIRMHNFGAGLAYDIKNLHLEAEYIYKWYQDKLFKPTQALYGFAFYKFKIGKSWLDNIALSARYDAITPNYTCKLNPEGFYTQDIYRQRLTTGVTFVMVEKPVRGAIRIDYEKYFFHKGVECKDDRLIIELITHFQ